MSAFPIDLGMSEGEIVDRLVPEYGQILCDWEREGLPSEDAFERAGAVEEWVETDFGLKGREFLLVSVSGSTGVCAQCFYRRIAVFELHGKEIVFRFVLGGIDSLGWQANERRFFAVVRLGPEDRALLSFAVAGTRDCWERPLSAVGDPWPFGFVLTPVAALPPK